MPYQRFPLNNFGKGLNLRDKPDAVDQAEAIDALNVLFTESGAVKQRGGYDYLTESELTNRVGSLEPFYTTSNSRQLLAGCGTRLEAIGTSGNIVASATGLENGTWDFARFGKPNGESAYAGNGKDTLRKWSGTEWSAPTATVNGAASKAMPKAGALAVWAAFSNRLVASRFTTTTGGPNGAASSPDHVYFSDPGDPTSWTDTNYVQLSPGDGEAIKAVVVWRELLFVFKETKFFVFDRAGAVNEEGDPEFLFRPIEGGAGLASPKAICVHPTGGYFMGRHGVYRTTGNEAELLSYRISPIFEGSPSEFYTGGTLEHSAIESCAMAAFDERIYLSFPTSSANNRTLVYDPKYDWWALTDLPCAAMTSFRAGSREELAFGTASGAKHVALHSASYTNDAEAAITSYWRSGWDDLGTRSIKKIRMTKVWGTGKVQMAIGRDFNQGVGILGALDFTDPEATKWGEGEWGQFNWAQPKGLVARTRRISSRGADFSVYLTNSTLNQDFSVHIMEHLVPEVRNPAVQPV